MFCLNTIGQNTENNPNFQEENVKPEYIISMASPPNPEITYLAFTVVVVSPNNLVQIKCYGNTFNAQASQAFSRVMSGDTVYIESIRAKNKEGKYVKVKSIKWSII